MRIFQKLAAFFSCSLGLLLSGCAHESSHAPAYSYDKSLQTKVTRYAASSTDALMPDFEKAHVSFPPDDMALLVFKDTKTMQLWAKSGPATPWHYVKSYPLLAASGHSGPKLKNNDRQVPEGLYNIVFLNPDSQFHLSMELNYPNPTDRYHAKEDGRDDLGNHIFIHGSHYSVGCMAIGDPAIEQLFVLSYWVGVKHIKVIVAPRDFRKTAPKASDYAWEPKWVPSLYQQISVALKQFNPHPLLEPIIFAANAPTTPAVSQPPVKKSG